MDKDVVTWSNPTLDNYTYNKTGWFSSAPISVIGGNTLYFYYFNDNTIGKQKLTNINEYDKNGAFVTTHGNVASVVLSEDTAYVAFSYNSGVSIIDTLMITSGEYNGNYQPYGGVKHNKNKKEIEKVNEEIEKVNGLMEIETSDNLLDNANILQNKRIRTWSNPTINDYTYDTDNSYTSPIMLVEPGKTYAFIKNGAKVKLKNVIGEILFKQDGSFLQLVSSIDIDILIPDETYYVAFTTNNNDFTGYNFKLINENTNFDYTEYGKLESKKLQEVDKRFNAVDQELKNAKEETKKLSNKLANKKAKILLNFDQTTNILTDGRNEMCKEYGFLYTFCVSNNNYGPNLTIEKVQELLKDGNDAGIYSAYNMPSQTEYDNEDLDWDTYVRTALEEANSVGVFNPTVWQCCMNRTGNALNKVLKKYGFKCVRGYKYGTYDPIWYNTEDWNEDEFIVKCSGLYPSTKDTILSYLNQLKGTTNSLCIMTHAFYDNESDAEKNFGCTAENYREVLEAIKEGVDSGEFEVITFREWYKELYPQEGYENDYNRLLKQIVFTS